jgi:hypothetical protein
MKKVNLKVLKFTLRRVRRYLLLFGVFLLLVSLGIFWLYQKNSETLKQIEVLKAKALPTTATVDIETVRELKDKAPLFASYLPDEFNLYQVIGLIEQIGRKTNFKIQSYSLQYKETVSDSLASQTLTLEGSGTLDEFMAFLKEYKFITGRLLTIDSVNLSGSKRLLTSLNVNIYAYKPNIVLEGQTIPVLSTLDRTLIQKVVRYSAPISENIPESNYSNKKNPFE